jgi:hypothetical protein
MPSLTHEFCIRRLLDRDPDLKTKRFAQELFETLAGPDDPDPDPDEYSKAERVASVRSEYGRLPRPDLFKIGEPQNGGDLHVTCIEVVRTSDVTPDKLLRYTDLWFALDCDNSFLTLLIYGHHGALLGRYEEADWQALWYGEVIGFKDMVGADR